MYGERYEFEPVGHQQDEPPQRGFSLFGFPFSIDPFFFLTAWLIGGRRDPVWIGVWIVIVLVGITAHELGHAFAGRRLGLRPWIRLFAFGGMTGWQNPRPLTARQQIFVSFAGPAVGLTIGGLVIAAALAGVFQGAPYAVARIVNDLLWVNLGWAILNLLPILPLDGGHITASAAQMMAGPRGVLGARVFSVVVIVAIGAWALVSREWWILILCVVFGYTNVQALRSELSPT
jgi:Zn-dependent protease